MQAISLSFMRKKITRTDAQYCASINPKGPRATKRVDNKQALYWLYSVGDWYSVRHWFAQRKLYLISCQEKQVASFFFFTSPSWNKVDGLSTWSTELNLVRHNLVHFLLLHNDLCVWMGCSWRTFICSLSFFFFLHPPPTSSSNNIHIGWLQACYSKTRSPSSLAHLQVATWPSCRHRIGYCLDTHRYPLFLSNVKKMLWKSVGHSFSQQRVSDWAAQK